MKPPSEWTEQELLEIIRLKFDESLQLDFKRAESLGLSDGKKTEISKDVSAFANSAGGTIVYGTAESKTKPSCAETLSPINPADFSKEWLEQIINSRIQPRIQGVVINPVTLSKGGVVYVVCIPQSTTAHQASDHRYYRRFNFESIAMEDYEVRQTMNRTSRAEYSVLLQATKRGVHNSELHFQFQGIVENTSEAIARDVSVILLVPKHLFHQDLGQRDTVIGETHYGRIQGTWPGTVQSGMGTPTNLPPLSPRMIFFERELATQVQPPEPLKVFVRIFDQSGAASTTEVLLSTPGLEIVSTKSVRHLL